MHGVTHTASAHAMHGELVIEMPVTINPTTSHSQIFLISAGQCAQACSKQFRSGTAQGQWTPKDNGQQYSTVV